MYDITFLLFSWLILICKISPVTSVFVKIVWVKIRQEPLSSLEQIKFSSFKVQLWDQTDWQMALERQKPETEVFEVW